MSTRVLDRNFVLQKQLERSCRRLQREYKITERKTQILAEGCVAFTYQLLYEATLKEKESLKYETLLAKIPNHTTGNKKSQPVNAAAYISRFRPQTAHAQNGTNKNLEKRPSSAHPLLQSEITIDNIQTNDKKESENSGVGNAWTTVKQKVQNKELINISDDPHSEDSRHTQNETIITGSAENVSHEIPKTRYRPKTADFYRKKQPENELAIFWSRKIRSVIEKWDQEDKEEDFIQSDTVTDTVSCKTRTTQCITPPLQQNVLTESDKRLRAFVRRFGSKYRTQMQPMTTSEVSKGGRKNFKISKQDLASIHADASRRMKNTKMILKKSGKIQANVERYAEHADEMVLRS